MLRPSVALMAAGSQGKEIREGRNKESVPELVKSYDVKPRRLR
jgi:hypothetical protein